MPYQFLYNPMYNISNINDKMDLSLSCMHLRVWDVIGNWFFHLQQNGLLDPSHILVLFFPFYFLKKGYHILELMLKKMKIGYYHYIWNY